MSLPIFEGPTAKAVLLAVFIVLGLFPAKLALKVIRARRLAVSADGSRAIEGRAAVVAGWVVLALIGALDVFFSYGIAQALWGLSINAAGERLLGVLLAALIYGALLLALVSAIVWRIRARRRARSGPRLR